MLLREMYPGQSAEGVGSHCCTKPSQETCIAPPCKVAICMDRWLRAGAEWEILFFSSIVVGVSMGGPFCCATLVLFQAAITCTCGAATSAPVPSWCRRAV